MISFRSTYLLLSLLVFVTAVLSAPESENVTEFPSSGDRSDYKKSLFENCDSSFSLTCMKLELVSWVDQLSQQDEYNLMPGVSLIKEKQVPRSETTQFIAEMAKSFPNDPETRLNVALFKKVSGFLNSRSLKVKFLPQDDDAEITGRGKGGGGGGGGGGGKKGNQGIFLAAIALLKGTLLAIALGTLAALAGKALMTGVIALVISSIIGLKSLAHHHHGKASYEVISKPIYSHEKTESVSHEDHHESHGHHYGRSMNDIPLPPGLRDDYKP